MLTQLESPELLFSDFIPQADIEYPVERMRKRFDLIEACDDLHDFMGAAFIIDGRLPFTIKHYRGGQKDSFTIYFYRESDIRSVMRDVDQIISYLEIPESSLRWDRSQDPDL